MLREFVTARVLGAFGLEGFVKIRSLSGETAHLLSQKEFTLRGGGGMLAGRDARYAVERIRESTGGVLLVKFAGIDTPEAAKTLRGAQIIAPRESAAALSKNEFYIEDLKGLTVRLPDGGTAGTVEDVIDGGGGQLVLVRLPDDALRFVPFRDEFFGDISVETGCACLRVAWILE
ncbi:MAG: ribosome maturation factor RimM [Spirochaetaceae bacterium]|jgi:16S rRNA processing protein RimM|nr:ribosome maturation factor RimM [Spirochaetaceae bacterium]